jgi:hypothetical protein
MERKILDKKMVIHLPRGMLGRLRKIAMGRGLKNSTLAREIILDFVNRKSKDSLG